MWPLVLLSGRMISGPRCVRTAQDPVCHTSIVRTWPPGPMCNPAYCPWRYEYKYHLSVYGTVHPLWILITKYVQYGVIDCWTRLFTPNNVNFSTVTINHRNTGPDLNPCRHISPVLVYVVCLNELLHKSVNHLLKSNCQSLTEINL